MPFISIEMVKLRLLNAHTQSVLYLLLANLDKSYAPLYKQEVLRFNYFLLFI